MQEHPATALFVPKACRCKRPRQVFWLTGAFAAFPFSQWPGGERLLPCGSAGLQQRELLRTHTVFPIIPLHELQREPEPV